MDLWTHDRWRFPLPDRHRFPMDKYAAAARPRDRRRHRAAGGAPRGRARSAGSRSRRCTTAGWSADPPRGAEPPRAAGPRPAVVAARWSSAPAARLGGTLAAARHALAHGLGMNLGGGTHHAGYAILARLLPVQRRRDRARGPARRARPAARAGGRLRRPPGRRYRRPVRVRPADVHALAARRAQLPVHARPLRPRRRPRQRHRRRRLPAGGRGGAGRGAAARGPGARLLPGGGRSVGGRPHRPPGAHQGGAARPRRAGPRPPDRGRHVASASSSRAATPRTCATPWTSTPPRRPPWRGGWRRAPPSAAAARRCRRRARIPRRPGRR